MAAFAPADAPALYSTEGHDDPQVHAVYYHADMGWSWFLLEYDRDTDTAFGLVDGYFEEYGYWTLAELAAVGCVRVDCGSMPLSVARLRTAA